MCNLHAGSAERSDYAVGLGMCSGVSGHNGGETTLHRNPPCRGAYTHFQMKTLARVATEMALHVLAYNLKRVITIMGIRPLIAAMMAA